MKKNMQKWISMIMVIVFVFSLAGCKAETDESMEQVVEDKTDVTFEGRNIELNGIDGNITDYTVDNQKIYMLVKSDTNNEDVNVKNYQFYHSDLDGNNTKCITQSTLMDDILLFCVDSMENITYVAVNSQEDRSIVEMVKIDNKGTELLRKDITKVVKDEVEWISNILEDNNKNIILTCGSNICFFDENFELVEKVSTKEGYVIDATLTKNNKLICVMDQMNSASLQIKVSLLDMKSKQWEIDINIKTGEMGETDCVFESTEYDFCYKEYDGIYGYDIETNASTELLNYDASYMTREDVDGLVATNEGSFIGKCEDFVDEKQKTNLVLYTLKDMNTDSKKQKITFGTFYATPDIKSAVAKYNRNNLEYEIVIQEYIDMDEERLLADIMAGKGQDIVDLDTFPFSVEQCITKGLIEDLTPYYESQDIEDIVPSVKKAMEKDGKLYYVTPSFSITSAVAKKEDVGDADGWTVTEFRELVEKKGEDVDLFAYQDIRISCLESLIINNMTDYIEWETGQCNFDSEEFKYLLSLSKERGLKEEGNVSEAEVIEEVNSQYRRLQEGKYILLEEDSVDLCTIQLNRKALGEDITYIGMPNKERQGSHFTFDNQFAISTQSKVKEQAWEFIRTFMSAEYQNTIECTCCMPTLQTMFDAKLKALTTKEAYVNEFGELIEPWEEYTAEYGDMKIEMKTPTQEDVEVYLDLLNKTTHCVDDDSVVFNIIVEEASGYFNGRRTLNKTVDNIQNRVTTYINEQK